MNRFMVMAVAAGMLAAGGTARAAEKEAPIDWPARSATVKVGMTRAEVAKIRLVPADEMFRSSSKTSSFHPDAGRLLYWKEDDWTVYRRLYYRYNDEEHRFNLNDLRLEKDRPGLFDCDGYYRVFDSPRPIIPKFEPIKEVPRLRIEDAYSIMPYVEEAAKPSDKQSVKRAPVKPQASIKTTTTNGVSYFIPKMPKFGDELRRGSGCWERHWELYYKRYYYVSDERQLLYKMIPDEQQTFFRPDYSDDPWRGRTIKKWPLVMAVNGTNYSVLPKNLKP